MTEPGPCTFRHCVTLHYSSSVQEPAPLMVRFRRARFTFLQCMTPWLAPYLRKKKRTGTSSRTPGPGAAGSDLRPGDLVEVRSYDEIRGTLNSKGMHRGLFFMPEQKRFCGQRFKVRSVPRKVLLELTGEVRQINTPAIYLEGVFCDGEFHKGCERSCFLMWREEWLKKVPAE